MYVMRLYNEYIVLWVDGGQFFLGQQQAGGLYFSSKSDKIDLIFINFRTFALDFTHSQMIVGEIYFLFDPYSVCFRSRFYRFIG